MASDEGRISHLRIADISVDMFTTAPGLELRLSGCASRFAAPALQPDLRVEIGWQERDLPPPGEVLFDAGNLWRLHRDGDGFLFRFTSPAAGASSYKSASFSRDFRAGVVRIDKSRVAEGEPLYPLEYPLDEIVVGHLLARGRGAEVHACGVVDREGRGLLFCGQSGDGKTTMARLWESLPGCRILSDDRIVLRRLGGRTFIYGTPWHGEGRYSLNERAALDGVFFLAHGLRNQASRLTAAQATALFMARAFPPFYCRESLAFTVDFFGAVAESVPCFGFSFVPDGEAPRYIARWVEGGAHA